jgi:cytochrome P450
MTTIQPAPAQAPVEAPAAPGALPLLGHLHHLRRDAIGFFQGLRPLGPVVRIGFGPKPAYVVNDPELIRRVFVTDAGDYGKGVFWEKVRAFVGDGLASVDSGDFHLRQRRLMQPAFHRNRIAQFAETMAAHFTERARSWQPGQVLAMHTEMEQAALTLVARTFFSSRLGKEAAGALEENFPVVQQGIVSRTLSPVSWPEKLPTPGNRRFHASVRRIWAATDHAIASYRASEDDQGDLLSMLIHARDEETGEAMDDDLIRDQVLTIALSGRDTTSNALTWSLHQLSRRPDVAGRIAAEVAEVAGDAPLTFEDLMRLEYTGRVAREIFRLYAFWLLIRETTTDVALGGVRIPAKTQVLVSPATMHRDPEIYRDPMRLDPDRWLPERAAEVPRHAYFPFGSGNRQCIGDRYATTALVLGMATIVRHWELHPIPGHEVREVAKVSLCPSSVPLRVEPRRATAAA